MKDIESLLERYKSFYSNYFQSNQALYQELQQGQSPRILFIGCSDSRVDPAIITEAKPGELFVIRNVANQVPPYQPDPNTYHGTSAALEFAVRNLQVEHIIVLGHSRCAGIRVLLEQSPTAKSTEYSFVDSWMQIAKEARESVVNNYSHLTIDEQAGLCEEKSVTISLRNLLTFPYIAESVRNKKLSLHGWHFDLSNGELRVFDPKLNTFTSVMEVEAF